MVAPKIRNNFWSNIECDSNIGLFSIAPHLASAFSSLRNHFAYHYVSMLYFSVLLPSKLLIFSLLQSITKSKEVLPLSPLRAKEQKLYYDKSRKEAKN